MIAVQQIVSANAGRAANAGQLRAATVMPLVALLSLLGCNHAPSSTVSPSAHGAAPATVGLPIFADITSQAGIAFTYRNGEEADQYTILETLGGGIALIDYDGDGLLDIFLTGGGRFGANQEITACPCKLYRNEGNWRVRDVTAEVGLDRINFYTHGVAVGDYDNDGWPDLLVTGYGHMALFRNNHGKFEDVTAQAGLAEMGQEHWSTSAAFGDFDGDGYLDLYVCHYADWSFRNHPHCPSVQPGVAREVCPPTKFLPLPHRLYHNQRNGTFREVGKEAGLKLEKTVAGGRGLGVILGDFDDDGKLDIYVTNDESDNWLYLNRSQGSGLRFVECGVARGVADNDFGKPDGSMGVDCGDYDGSGRLSLFVTNYVQEVHALYRNGGGGQFRHQSGAAGIKALGMNFSGWGTAFVDWDLNGVEHLVFVAGHPQRHPIAPQQVKQRAVLLRNSRPPDTVGGRVLFEDISEQGGEFFRGVHRGRGLAVGDLNNVGKPDLIISNVNEPVVLLRNQLQSGHHWLGVELVGKPNRDAIGARATLEIGGHKLMRVVKGGGSYLSSGDRRLLFGLGAATTVGKLTVRWPSGREQVFEDLPIDRYVKILEGEPVASGP